MREDARMAMQILKGLHQKSRRIEEIRIRILECREMATRATSSMSASNNSGTGGRSRVETAVISIADLEAQLMDIEADLCRDRVKIQAAIEGIQGDERKRLLELRYIDGKSWMHIRKALHVSKSTSYRIHCDALESFYSIYKSPGA